VEARSVRPEDDVNGDGYISLKAAWGTVAFTVKFDTTWSSATVASQLIANRGKVVQPVNPNPPSDGSGFAGWFMMDGTGGNWGKQWDFANDLVTGNMTLYAKWEYQTRTVVFRANDGTRPDGSELTRTHFTIAVSYGAVLDPGPLVRSGHSFGGWYTDPACTNQWIFATDRIREADAFPGVDPFYLYAKWVPNIYFVTFDANGGSPEPARQQIAHGERVRMPARISMPEMAFEGWFPNAGGQWNFDTDTVQSTMTLHARWGEITYIVNFYLGNPGGNPPNAVFAMPSAQQVIGVNGIVTEPFMPSLPSSRIPHDWSFYRWYYNVSNGKKPGDINSASQSNRDLWLKPWDFTKPISTVTDAVFEGDEQTILNLYARWVPPVSDMVWVPRGSFTMGDAGVSGSPAAYHAYPTRRVTVDGFYISRTEVTQKEYYDAMSRASDPVNRIPSQFTNGNAVRPNHPVERVSWFDAIRFSIHRTEQANTARKTGEPLLDQVYTNFSVQSRIGEPVPQGLPLNAVTSATFDVNWIPDSFSPGNRGFANGYRLPTEAEWEFAARGGHESPGNFMYAGSNNAAAVAWYNESVKTRPEGDRATQAVGGLQPNALGIFDMSGNVSEWCWDWFVRYNNNVIRYEVSNPRGPENPVPLEGSQPPYEQRVRRGGGWSNAAGNVRSVVRNSDTPDTAHWVVGFRVVRGPWNIW
jgi:formylglycine-generating enzyme required for sulfatase activity